MKTVIGIAVMSFLTHIMNSPLSSLTVTEEAPNPIVTAEKVIIIRKRSCQIIIYADAASSLDLASDGAMARRLGRGYG